MHGNGVNRHLGRSLEVRSRCTPKLLSNCHWRQAGCVMKARAHAAHPHQRWLDGLFCSSPRLLLPNIAIIRKLQLHSAAAAASLGYQKAFLVLPSFFPLSAASYRQLHLVLHSIGPAHCMLLLPARVLQPHKPSSCPTRRRAET